MFLAFHPPNSESRAKPTRPILPETNKRSGNRNWGKTPAVARSTQRRKKSAALREPSLPNKHPPNIRVIPAIRGQKTPDQRRDAAPTLTNPLAAPPTKRYPDQGTTVSEL